MPSKVRRAGDLPVSLDATLCEKDEIVGSSATVEAALPWLYMKGVSSGEIGAVLEVFVGPKAQVYLYVLSHV